MLMHVNILKKKLVLIGKWDVDINMFTYCYFDFGI